MQYQPVQLMQYQLTEPIIPFYGQTTVKQPFIKQLYNQDVLPTKLSKYTTENPKPLKASCNPQKQLRSPKEIRKFQQRTKMVVGFHQ